MDTRHLRRQIFDPLVLLKIVLNKLTEKPTTTALDFRSRLHGDCDGNENDNIDEVVVVAAIVDGRNEDIDEAGLMI